ncbi:MAG: hypothetical protein WC302_00015 [Candidatus Paceibacterota bacterium]|jgi:hypothetical protein
MKKILASLLFLSVLVPSFSFAQNLPSDADEAKELLEKGLEAGEEQVPELIKKMWEEDVLPVWNKMFEWFKSHIWSKFMAWFNEKVTPEIEERTPHLEEEFEKETEEAKEELPVVGKSLWDKLKEIFQQ